MASSPYRIRVVQRVPSFFSSQHEYLVLVHHDGARYRNKILGVPLSNRPRDEEAMLCNQFLKALYPASVSYKTITWNFNIDGIFRNDAKRFIKEFVKNPEGLLRDAGYAFFRLCLSRVNYK